MRGCWSFWVGFEMRTAAIAGLLLAGCAVTPEPGDVAGPIVSSTGVVIELSQSRPVSSSQRRYAIKIADEIWARACASGAQIPCNAGSYYRLSMTLELKRDIYCLGTMAGPLAGSVPMLQPDGTVRRPSPWVERVEFRCLTSGEAFIENWY
jgi:hypothetical protein